MVAQRDLISSATEKMCGILEKRKSIFTAILYNSCLFACQFQSVVLFRLSVVRIKCMHNQAVEEMIRRNQNILTAPSQFPGRNTQKKTEEKYTKCNRQRGNGTKKPSTFASLDFMTFRFSTR